MFVPKTVRENVSHTPVANARAALKCQMQMQGLYNWMLILKLNLNIVIGVNRHLLTGNYCHEHQHFTYRSDHPTIIISQLTAPIHVKWIQTETVASLFGKEHKHINEKKNCGREVPFCKSNYWYMVIFLWTTWRRKI